MLRNVKLFRKWVVAVVVVGYVATRDIVTELRGIHLEVHPTTRTSNQTIELRDNSTPKKPRRNGKMEARKTVGTISETLAH